MTDRERERLRSAIEIRLVDMPRHLAAMRDATAEFGENFEYDSFVAAARSDDVHELHHLYAVERPFELLQNYIVELVRLGLQLNGLIERRSRRDARRDLDLLNKEGVITEAQSRRLLRLQEIRNLMAHEYAVFEPELVHEGVRTLLEELPKFLKRYRDWLSEDLDLEPSGSR